MRKKTIIVFSAIFVVLVFFVFKKAETIYPKYPYVEIPEDIEEVGKFENGVFIIKKNGKYGLMRIDTTIAADPVWDSIEKFNENGHSIVKRGKKNGVINEHQDIIIPLEYDFVKYVKYAKNFIVCKAGKWGIVNWKNNIILPLEYDGITETKYGKYIVKKGMFYGVANSFGNTILSPKFIALNQINRKTYIGLTEKSRKYHIIGSDNDFTEAKLDLSDKYDRVLSFCPHMSIVKKGEDDFLLNLTSYDMKLIGSGYKVVSDFTNQMAVIQDRNGREGVINEEGDVIIEPKYQMLSLEEDDLILFKEGKNYGYMDRMENIVVPAAFKELTPFYKDRAIFRIDGKEGVIDIKGQVVVMPEYMEVIGIKDNIYILRTEKGVGVFDKKGREIIPAKYYSITFFGDNALKVIDKDNVKIFNYAGKEILSVKLSDIQKEWKDNGQLNLKKKIYLFN